jgi:hypothetical protein
MSRRVLDFPLILSVLGLLVLGWMAARSLLRPSMIGWCAFTPTPLPSTMLPTGWAHYRVHIEYRGVFFDECRIALGYVVNDTEIGVERSVPMQPKSGYGVWGGYPRWVVVRENRAWWNVIGLEAGTIRRGTPGQRDVLRAGRVRFNVLLPFLLFAIYPATRLLAAARRVRNASRGSCPACGYDLRATPDRCPECEAPAP